MKHWRLMGEWVNKAKVGNMGVVHKCKQHNCGMDPDGKTLGHN